MNEIEFKKLRFRFIQKCYLMNKCLKIQDQERHKIYDEKQKELNHIFVGKILTSPSKEYYTLINHNELLRYSIESDEVTELKYDIDFNEYEDKEENIKQAVKIAKTLCSTIQNKLRVKPYAYYSGGKGIHVNILIAVPEGIFEEKLNNMTHKSFDAEKYKRMSQERAKFKKKVYQYLNLSEKIIKYIDTSNSFSAETLLTLEGAKKRGEGKKYKTKIQHNYDVDTIMRFIKSDYSPFIDFKFFEPQEIDADIINNIINYDVKKEQEKKKKKRETISNEQTYSKEKKSSQNRSHRLQESKNAVLDVYEHSYNELMKLKQKNKAVFTECLANSIVRLKEKKQDKSFNTFTYYVMKLLLYLKYTDEEIKIIYSKLIIPKTSLNVSAEDVEIKYNTQLKNAKEWLENNTDFKFNFIHKNKFMVFSAKGLMLSVKSEFYKRCRK